MLGSGPCVAIILESAPRGLYTHSKSLRLQRETYIDEARIDIVSVLVLSSELDAGLVVCENVAVPVKFTDGVRLIQTLLMQWRGIRQHVQEIKFHADVAHLFVEEL